MPNIVAHYLCGKILCEHLKIKDKKKFLLGCVDPDYNNLGHFRRRYKDYYLTPNLDEYLSSVKEFGDYEKGNFCHLALDRIFLEEYLPYKLFIEKGYDPNIFQEEGIYRDYSIISSHLMKYFDSEFNEIVDICKDADDFDAGKFENVINQIKNENPNNKMKYLDVDDFIEFIKFSSVKIKNQLLELENSKTYN